MTLEPPNETKTKEATIEDYSNYTLAAIEDEVLYCFLSSKKNGRFYYAQADFYLNRINIFKPYPVFVLHDEDIPEGLENKLDNLGEAIKKRIITNVVRRIYETIDERYVHINGIHGKLKWRFLEHSKE